LENNKSTTVQCKAHKLNSQIASFVTTIFNMDHVNTNTLIETGSVIFHPEQIEIKFNFLYEECPFIKYFIQNYVNDDTDMINTKYPYAPMHQTIKEEIMINGELKSLYSGAIIYTKHHLEFLPNNLDKSLLNWFTNGHNPIVRS